LACQSSQRDVFEELFAVTVTLGSLPPAALMRIVGATERFLDGLVRGMQALLLDGIGRKKSGLAAFLFYGSDPSIAALGISAKQGNLRSSASEAFGQRST